MKYFTSMLVNIAYQSKMTPWSGYIPYQRNSLIDVLLHEWKKENEGELFVLLHEVIIRSCYFIMPNWQLLGLV